MGAPGSGQGVPAALAGRRDQLRRLANRLTQVGGWSVDVATGHIDWSEEIYAILEVRPGEEPPLDDAMAMFPPEDRPAITAAMEACMTAGTPFDLELEVITARGRRIPVRSIGEAERDAAGRVVRVTGALQDITDLRRATTAAEAAARRLHETLESMTDAVYLLDRDWRFTYLNQRAAQLLRQDRYELLGQNVWETFPEAADSAVYPAYTTAMATGTPQVLEEFYFPPLQTWFSVHAYPGEHGLAVYFRDVSAAHDARVALQRQALLLDAAQDAIIVRDLGHRITYWNRSAERIYGWAAEEVVGRDVRGLLYHEPGDFDAAMAEVLGEGMWVGELRQRTRHGKTVTVAARWTLVEQDPHTRVVLALNTDITEHKRVELQLLRAQRMESLGTLAGGIAHDLNNVLAPIQLAAEMLQQHEPLAATAAPLVDTILTSARRGADLVGQVLSFARGADGVRAPVDLGRLLRDVRAIVADTFPKDIRVDLQAPPDLGTTTGDSTQIQQVLMNLAVNARDAMPGGGHLTITGSLAELDRLAVAADLTPGPYVCIEVADDGVGMTAEVRERVFEPFFTTKPQGAGTGLGLSTAAAIVRSHAGLHLVDSEPGRGSRFRLYLPRTATPATRTESRSPTVPLPSGEGRTVLVVDDEEAVRTTTRRILEAHGYRVVEAADGAEAVSLFQQHHDRVAVVLTDMMMPVMDGPATVNALRQVDPTVRVVAASGLHGEGRVDRAADVGVRHFLPKPYTLDRLLSVLAEALADDPGRQ